LPNPFTPSLRQFRSFKKARAFVRSLHLKTKTEWDNYLKSGKKPDDIPTNPHRSYAETGWAGWRDWIGIGRRRHGIWWSFKKARAFVHGVGLKSTSEWSDYCKSGNKPEDILATPARAYAEAGWSGMGDWLGTDTVAPYLRKYWPFKKARAHVRRLDLKSGQEWQEYCKSGKKPDDIPAAVERVYPKSGWAGMGDWLGKQRGTDWKPFKKARNFARRLGLKSAREWHDYSKTGKRPADIPAAPSTIYAKTGWAGFPDWLGYA
jgi:hypothetical protein